VRGKKRPLARSEHTATKVGQPHHCRGSQWAITQSADEWRLCLCPRQIAANKILYFGGWCEFPLNDVHVLDVGSWEWSQPEIR
jgi:hypothetical protein